VIATIETKSGSHDTIYANDGSCVYLALLKSPLLSIADPKVHKVASTVGPFDISPSPPGPRASALGPRPLPDVSSLTFTLIKSERRWTRPEKRLILGAAEGLTE